MQATEDYPSGDLAATCQSCGEKAVFHFTSIDGGRAVERHYCSKCVPAKEADQIPQVSLDLTIEEGQETKESFLLWNKLIVIKVEVNNEGPFSFIVDTGANKTFFAPWLAEQLKISRISKRPIQGPESGEHERNPKSDSFGICREARRLGENARLGFLRIGNIVLRKLEIIIADIFSSQDRISSSERVAGIIGSDVLSRYVVTIDYRNGWIELKKP